MVHPAPRSDRLAYLFLLKTCLTPPIAWQVEATVRKVLAQTFGGADARYWTNAAEDSRAGMSDGDVFPYVSLVLNAD